MARPEVEPKTPLGRRIRAVRAHFGEDDRDAFAERLGISKSALAHYERGERVPDASVLASYREILGINLAWLVSDIGDMFDDPSKGRAAPPIQVDAKTVQEMHSTMERLAEELLPSEPRQYGRLKPPPPPATIKYLPYRASAGGGAVVPYETDGIEMDLERLARQILDVEPKFVRLLVIRGDSMLPTLMDGDVVVFDISDPKPNEDPQGDKIYVISYHGELLAKRAEWQGVNTLLWRSDNEDPHFAPIEVSGDDLNRVRTLGRVIWMWRPL